MNGQDVLAGIENVPWHEIPGGSEAAALLSAVASGDEDAFWELVSRLCDAGALYPVTAPVVPFVARMAVAGVLAADMLILLSLIGANAAEEGFPVDDDMRAAGEAVTGQLDLILPLLDHPDAAVREAAVFAVTECNAAERVAMALSDRWVLEDVPRLQAALVRALARLDPPIADVLAEGVSAGDEDPTVRVVAATACIATGLSWKEEFRDAAITWIRRGGCDLHLFWWRNGDPLTELVEALATRGDLEIASGLVTTCLAQPAAPGLHESAELSASILRPYGFQVPEA